MTIYTTQFGYVVYGSATPVELSTVLFEVPDDGSTYVLRDVQLSIEPVSGGSAVASLTAFLLPGVAGNPGLALAVASSPGSPPQLPYTQWQGRLVMLPTWTLYCVFQSFDVGDFYVNAQACGYRLTP